MKRKLRASAAKPKVRSRRLSRRTGSAGRRHRSAAARLARPGAKQLRSRLRAGHKTHRAHRRVARTGRRRSRSYKSTYNAAFNAAYNEGFGIGFNEGFAAEQARQH